MKKFIKEITPPFLYSWARKIFVKPPRFTPEWVTLSYEPMRGVKMFFDPHGTWQKKLLDASYDDFFFDQLKKLDLTGKTVFDIGAHVGFHSLYFARMVGPTGHIYAFEPNPKNIERLSIQLKENPDLEKRISVFDIALSDKKGVEEFTMNEDVESGRSTGGFIESADAIWSKETFIHRGFVKRETRTLPLDLVFEELKTINGSDIAKPYLLKIDVEGAESLVLKGAEKTVKEYQPLILLEIHSTVNMFKIMSFFSMLPYDLEILKKEDDGRCFIKATPRKTTERK